MQARIPAAAACKYALEQAYRNRGKGGRGGYIWGAHGEKCTPAMRAEWARRALDQAATINGTGAKWDGVYCWDCSGLLRGMTRELLEYISGGATTQFNLRCVATGRLDSRPDLPGILVFRAKSGSDTQMAHVGLYVGNGMVVHARGTSYGVVYESIDKHAWTHWGAAEYIDLGIEIEGEVATEMAVLYKATVKTKESANVNIWSSSAKTRSLGKVPRGAEVEVLDNSAPAGWVYARYKGISGYMDAQYLVKVPGSEPAPEVPAPPAGLGVGVYIAIADKATAEAVAAALRGAVAVGE